MKNKILFVLVSILAVVSLAACGTTPAVVAGGTPPQTRVLSSNGEGIVYLTPDVAYIYVGVRAEADEVSIALNNNNVQANAVAQTLKEMGVEDKDIQTTSFNVYPMQDYGMDGTVTRKYYVVENTVFIKVRELSNLGNMIDAVVRSGANTINSVSFDVQDKEAAIAEARDLAIADAMAEAEAIAKASGLKLGDIQTISVYANNMPSSIYDGKGGAYAMEAGAPIAAGQMMITANASINYEIK